MGTFFHWGCIVTVRWPKALVQASQCSIVGYHYPVVVRGEGRGRGGGVGGGGRCMHQNLLYFFIGFIYPVIHFNFSIKNRLHIGVREIVKQSKLNLKTF